MSEQVQHENDDRLPGERERYEIEHFAVRINVMIEMIETQIWQYVGRRAQNIDEADVDSRDVVPDGNQKNVGDADGNARQKNFRTDQ